MNLQMLFCVFMFITGFSLLHFPLCGNQKVENFDRMIEKIHFPGRCPVLQCLRKEVFRMEAFYSYGILTLSTVMFGVMFFFNDLFRRHYGSGLQATLVMSVGGGVFGLAALLLI